MKKYSVIPQKGEMAYRQPTFFVAISSEDSNLEYLAHSDRYDLIVATHTVTTIRMVDNNAPTVDRLVTKFTICSTTSVVVNKWRKNYTRMGWRCPESPAKRKGHYTLYGLRDFKPNRKDVVRYEEVWRTSINSYQDVADLANYFGDRLPPKFYETYKGILVCSDA